MKKRRYFYKWSSKRFISTPTSRLKPEPLTRGASFKCSGDLSSSSQTFYPFIHAGLKNHASRLCHLQIISGIQKNTDGSPIKLVPARFCGKSSGMTKRVSFPWIPRQIHTGTGVNGNLEGSAAAIEYDCRDFDWAHHDALSKWKGNPR
jgi:hypothetical protein